MQNLQSYFTSQGFDFTRWLRDQGVHSYSDQVQIIANITGQYPNVVYGWGNYFERMPDFFKGMMIGYLAAQQPQQNQQFYPHPNFNWNNGRQFY